MGTPTSSHSHFLESTSQITLADLAPPVTPISPSCDIMLCSQLLDSGGGPRVGSCCLCASIPRAVTEANGSLSS